ncbi:hypothetical protein [Amycolatopsis palatopharyngis]|uniref:hypothetical protein n=1 Tax=Amycolatopsis palatopharyngis TaxID=187982 RepID=UPI000E28002C|nr:hypothetical protein [Amycolatopsis palatopharyngis]
MTNDDLALRVAALKVVSDYTTRRYNEARAEAAERMERGDRLMARSPLAGVKVGAVSKSDPKPVARVTDEKAFTDWVRKNYPDRMVYDFDVIGSTQEVVSVLFEHAPHLLRKITKPDPELVREIRADSVGLGAPVGPAGEADVDGLEVTTPDGIVSCKPDPEALAAVVDLIRADKLSLEGLVRAELPGGAE